MAHKVTIGRNPISDYCVPQNFDKVSNNHAEIEERDGRLILIDHSSNGTYVNGRKVHNAKVEITYGDKIILANTYTLSWSFIRGVFPEGHFATRPIEMSFQGRATQIHNTPVNPVESFRDAEHQYPGDIISERGRVRNSWNWGAFLLGWIWAIGHSIIWPMYIVIGLTIILVVLPMLVPLSLIITLWIYYLLIFALNIYLGVKGNFMAWDNGCYDNVAHFREKERKWTLAAIIVWGGIFLSLITLYIMGLSTILCFLD